MTESITIIPPTIRLTVRMPRFYGLRLLVASWCIGLAGFLAGGALDISVEDMPEGWLPEFDA